MVRRFRKKPVEIEALEWTGSNLDEVLSFLGKPSDQNSPEFLAQQATVCSEGLKIETLEGWLLASVGDIIIKGVKGEFYPCKPDVFKATYEAV